MKYCTTSTGDDRPTTIDSVPEHASMWSNFSPNQLILVTCEWCFLNSLPTFMNALMNAAGQCCK